MKQIKPYRLLAVLSLCCCATILQAGTRDDIAALQIGQQELEQRLDSIESRLGNQGLLELMQQLEQLQTEVRELRGIMESYTNDLDGLRKRQRDLYLDIDRRLSDLQLSGPVGDASSNTDTSIAADSGTLPASAATDAAVTASVTNVATSSDSTAAADPAQERAEYKAAFDMLKEGRYEQAIEAFNIFINKYPNGNYAGNAQYWLGEANYAVRNFEQAMLEFTRVIERFPRSLKIPGAKLKIAYTHYELQQWDKAREVLNDIIKTHPNASVASLAEKRLLRLSNEGH